MTIKNFNQAAVIGGLMAVVAAIAPATRAANTWDGTAGTNWWFAPTNWSRDSANDIANGGPFLPPGQLDTMNVLQPTDTQINIGWNLAGEGVVYDPDNDPNFASAAGRPFPPSFGFQTVDGVANFYLLRELYISRNTTLLNRLTIKSGQLALGATGIIGRSTNVVGAVANGEVIQTGGYFKVNSNSLDLGNREVNGTSQINSWGNGVYDYRGGKLEVSLIGGSGLRLAAGGSAGTGGIGRFIMHNPATAGYVRVYDMLVAANLGTTANLNNANGVTNGVGIVEFHFENGGTRPIQVDNQLQINNGTHTQTNGTTGTRSSRLDLRLDAAPTIDGGGVPQNLGLFDVDFNFDPLQSTDPSGAITGDGDLGRFFSSADGSTLYAQDAIVSAIFGNRKYNWKISYSGDITWTDPQASTVNTIAASGGVDIVLMGDSSALLDPDFNNNGFVDGGDFLIWQRGFGGPGTAATGDADGNLVVDANDYAIWKSLYGNAFPASAALTGVPEPASLTMTLAAILAFNALRRRC